MSWPSDVDDEEPFSEMARRTVDLPADLAGSLGSDDRAAAHRVRLAVEYWAIERGFTMEERSLAARPGDGAVVTAPLYAMTENLAVVSCASQAPVAVTLSLATSGPSWVHDVFARFGSEPVRTGDPEFDERFAVRTSDERLMQEILHDDVRASLLAMDAKDVWCNVTYVHGQIELRLDTPHLAGIHLLGAIEAVSGMARARLPPVPGSAYR